MTSRFKIEAKPFGKIGDEEIFLYQLSNGNVDIEIINYGATIVSIFTPDKLGNKQNVVAGFDNLSQYKIDEAYLGCVVGRFANRIAFGKFSIDGVGYQLPVNNGVNHLHGGFNGFNKKVWKLSKTIDESDKTGLVLSYFSKEGEEGYPGNLNVTVTYTLNSNNELSIEFNAETDQKTIISLTNHSYFNLTGFEEATIHDHYLLINTDRYTVKNENNTPSGERAVTEKTPLHFVDAKKLGQDINQLVSDMGYDHNFVLNNNQKEVAFAAHLFEKNSGRSLKIFTNQPGMQVYTANWWDGTISGYQGKRYIKHGAVALETQAFPDAPNHNNFPPVILSPGETYSKLTIFQFSTLNNQ